jgi:hypothetical protein
MRRLLLLATFAAFALAAPASAAVPGVNVSYINQFGDPYAKDGGNAADYAHYPGDTAGSWQDLEDSGAKSVRAFVPWSQGLTDLNAGVAKYGAFADKARAAGMQVYLVVTGNKDSMAAPGDYATSIGKLAAALKGRIAAYEIWNEPDGPDFWAGGPQPAAYAALLKAAYPAVKAADPGATVVTGGMIANDADFLGAVYANGAQGSFDAVGVHTDTACLTADPGDYYREPDGRIGRYSFTGYRELHAIMAARGDAKPIWMTELGWSTLSATCARGDRAGTKPAGVSAAQQAQFLAKAYSCLAADPYVQQATWFNLHDANSSSPSGDDQHLGLLTDARVRKDAFTAFQSAGAAGPVACGGVLDKTPPTVRISAPTGNSIYLAALKIAVSADDDQGVTNVDLFMDGKEIPVVTKSQTATAAKVSLEWQGAKKLAYGPHTLVAKAYDEAKNLGTATVKVTKVGGGKYKIAIATKLDLELGKVSHRKLSLRGKVIPAQKLASVAGKTQITFERKQGKKWIGTSRFSKGAKSPFKFTYRFKKPGTWRVKAKFTPKKGSSYKASTLKPTILRVR